MSAPLETLLARYPAATRPVRPPESLGNAGGMSGARLWRFESDRGTLVARAWPPSVSWRDVAVIHARLKMAASLDFIPVPLVGRDGSTIQEVEGTVWEVSPWMPGQPDLASPPHRDRVRAAFQGLARFHQAIRSSKAFAPALRLSRRADEVRRLRELDLASWRYRVLRSPADDPRRDLALRWIDAAAIACPTIERELRIACVKPVPFQHVLRDARPDHFLFTGERLTGLVDFGAMGLDTVSADLSRLISEWLGKDDGLRSEALASYGQVRPLGDDEVGLIDVYSRSSALLGGGQWLRWHFVAQITFEDPDAVRRGLERGVARVLDLLA